MRRVARRLGSANASKVPRVVVRWLDSHPMRGGPFGCRRGVAALEFVLSAGPLLLLLFGFIATNTIFYTWSTMQNNAQYAARMMSTGQAANLATGPITATNTSSTVTCDGTQSATQVEYFACTGLPGWARFTVTATEDCSVPSVAVSVSVGTGMAALGDVFSLFSGGTLVARSVLMKEGTCP
jgi:Flp pilus assembly protein TadG